MGGLGGAAIAKAGFPALQLGGWVNADPRSSSSRRCWGWRWRSPSPWGCRGCSRARRPGPLDRVFRRLQLVSAALYSLSHGANDAQKTMGIIVGLLVSTQALFAARDRAGCATCTCPPRTGFRSGSRWRPTRRSASARRSAAGAS